MRGLLAAALLLTLLPTAAGQEPGVRFELTGVDWDMEVLRPNVDVARAVVTWTVTCNGPASQPQGLVIPSSTIQFQQPTPYDEGLTISGALSVSTPMPDCVTTMTTDGTSDFAVSASLLAWSETPLRIGFEATLLSPQTETAQDTPAEPLYTTIQVAYVGEVAAKVPVTIQDGSVGSTFDYAMEVTNFGNAPSILDIAVRGDQPSHGDLELPAPIVIDRHATVTIPVRYHATSSGEQTLSLELTPRSTRTGEAGEPIQVNFLARSHSSIFHPTPPVPVAALALAVLALAAAARRLR